MIKGIGACWAKVTGLTMVRLLLLLCCLNPLHLAGQNYPSRHFTMRDGLPSMSIRCIFKDTRGLLWIGTDAGLCSFDGRSFRIFKSSEGMTASQVWAIAEDEQGNMWFGSHGEGLFKYDGKHFVRFTKKNGLAEDHIRVLCYSKNAHSLFAGGYKGISIIRGENITNSLGDKALGKIRFTCITSILDAGKFIYITTYNHFSPIRYYPDQNKYISLHDSSVFYPRHSFSTYLTSKRDTIFSFTNKGVWIYKNGGIVKNDTLGQIFGITEDRRGDLWFASWSIPGMERQGGVFRYDGNTFRNYTLPFGITDREVWTVLSDREQDLLWIGTLNEGLFMVPGTTIENFPASYFSQGQKRINDIYLDTKNKIWISGNRDLTRIDSDGSLTNLKKHLMIVALRRFWNNRNQLPYPQEFKARLAVSKIDNALLPDFEKKHEFNFSKIAEDQNHAMLIPNEFGLFRYRDLDGRPEYLGLEGFAAELTPLGDTLIYSGEATMINPRFRESRIGISHNWDYPRSLFFTFTKDGDPRGVTRSVKYGNQIWYTTLASGLWMSQGTKLVNFNKSDSTIRKDLKDICLDEKGHVIFGSNTGEICIATYKNNNLKIDYRINGDSGLQGNSISWLSVDHSSKLWVGTNVGLNCIDLEKLYRKNEYVIRFIDEEEGYTGSSSGRALIDTAGWLWIGAGDKVIRFNTNNFNSGMDPLAKIVLKSFEINNSPADTIPGNGEEVLSKLKKGNLKLRYFENNLVFYYDILNYLNPRKDRFRYMLKGYDKVWKQGSSSRRAVYTNLPPGNYQFCVESYNMYSLDSGEPLVVGLNIGHPWWGLWYLQLLAILMVLLSAILAIRKYIQTGRQKEQRKSEIEKKIVQLEMQALQAQMNPHFIFNCVNGIQYYVLANKTDEVLSYLSDFSKVVRESLGNATLRVIPLEQEVSFLHSYLRLEQMRFSEKFDFTITSNLVETGETILIPPMLVQPFAENAVKHGFGRIQSKGHLSIIFEKGEEGIIKCTISDNGIGRERARLNSGFSPINDRPHSTFITGSRIRLFNPPGSSERYKIIYTDLSENGNSVGLMVELYIPMELRNG